MRAGNRHAPPFTLAGYVSLVREILRRGYEVRSFHDLEPDKPHLILRHDVDQSIEIARQLAAAETAEGWRSTWFVLVRTGMYNPFSKINVAHLRAMAADGHEIGLHLDATLYESDESIDRGAGIECRMIEDIVGAPVRLISFHRPAPHLIGGNRHLGGRLNTYMDRFFKDIGYSSDSRGEWRHGLPWEHSAVGEGRALQLLTHAIWWVGPEDRDRIGRIRDLIAAKGGELDAELSANLDIWPADGKARLA